MAYANTKEVCPLSNKLNGRNGWANDSPASDVSTVAIYVKRTVNNSYWALPLHDASPSRLH
jgi:hypothetical protein